MSMGVVRTVALLGVLTMILVIAGYLVGGMIGVVLALIVGAGLNLFSWWNSDKIVLRVQGANPIDENIQAPVLRRFVSDVHDLAARAGLPKPKVYLVESPQPNAFATGRNPDNAAVAVTSGLLNILNREEVAGVVAHELAHIKHRDTLTMTVTATIAGAISTLGYFGLFAGGRRGEDGNGVPMAGPIVMLMGPIAASLVQMAISRSREYEADRVGAEICGNPLWLASALEKIDRGVRASINSRAQRAPAMAHLFIANPLLGRPGDNLFKTHPAMKNRIEALRRMAAAKAVGRVEASRLDEDEDDDAPARARGPWG